MEPRIEQPDITPTHERRGHPVYRLDRDYAYTWEAEGHAAGASAAYLHRITVPAGFEHDGASVPRLLWTLLGAAPDGLHRAAALVHDFNYRHRGRLPRGSFQHYLPGPARISPAGLVVYDWAWYDCGEPVTRAQADRLFLRMMLEAGKAPARARVMYAAVRAFGWAAWRQRRAAYA